MHINAKKITFLGMLLSLSLILQLLGTGIAFNTLTFLVLSAMCLGIAIYETNLKIGAGFLLASIVLSALLSINKFHCLTHICMCIYIFFLEVLRKKTKLQHHFLLIWSIKLLFFNCCFMLPGLYFFKELMFDFRVSWNPLIYAAIIGAAQLFLLIFDYIYQRLIPDYWNHLKQQLHLDR